MALNKLCLNNKETLIFLHKRLATTNFVVQIKRPRKYYDSKKFPRKMWFRQGNNLTFKKILFYCTFPEEEKEETNAIETGKDKNIRSQPTKEASVMVTVSNSLLPT